MGLFQWILPLCVTLSAICTCWAHRGNGHRHIPHPEIRGPELDKANNTFHVYCDFSQMLTNQNTGHTLAVVTFYANSDLIHQVHNVSTSTVELPLGILKKYLNHNFRCEVGLYTNNQLMIRGSSFHNPFLGVVATRSKLEIEEDSEAVLKIRSTVPIICDHSSDCCVTLNLQLGGARNNLAVISECHYEICSNHWDPVHKEAVIEIPVLANRDDLDDGDQNVVIKFRPLLPSGGGEAHQVFQGLQIPDVSVTVKDVEPGVCSVTGDPHVRSFESSDPIHFFSVGDYLLYESKSNNFQIHGRTWPCGRNNKVSCLCGIVAREGNDVVKASICESSPSRRHRRHRHRNGSGHNSTPVLDTASELKLTVPEHGLQWGTKVHQQRQGNQVEIQFPSGASLEIKKSHSWVLGMKLTVPPRHRVSGDGVGICGTYDGNTNNELTDRNGRVHQCGRGHCRPDAFTQTWRLPRNETLFLNQPAPLQRSTSRPTASTPPPGASSSSITEKVYCGCHEDDSHTQSSLNTPKSLSNPNGASIECSNQAMAVKKTFCRQCDDVTGNIPPGLFGGNWVATRSLKYSDELADETDTFDAYGSVFSEVSDVTWPTSQNVTELQARSMCFQAVRKANTFNLCNNSINLIDTSVSECVTDFLMADGESLVNATVETFNTLCLESLQRNPVNFARNSKGQLTAVNAISADLCNQKCVEHGHCQRGTCICQPGWAGESCSLESGKGVELFEVIGGDTCDVRTRPCRRFVLDADNFESSHHLLCRITIMLQGYNWVNRTMYTRGYFRSSNELECRINDLHIGVGHFPGALIQISAAHDGKTFGNALNLIIEDSACSMATGQACVISNICFRNETFHDIHRRFYCNSYLNSNAWTEITHTVQVTYNARTGFFFCKYGEGPRNLLVPTVIEWKLMSNHVIKHQELHSKDATSHLSLQTVASVAKQQPNHHNKHLRCHVTVLDKITNHELNFQSRPIGIPRPHN